MLLNDIGDLDLNKPVCQKSAEKDTRKCEKDWISKNDQCYKFMTNVCRDGCSWTEAIQICNENNGYLTEGPDFGFLCNIAKRLAMRNGWWIGLSDLKNEGVYVRKNDGKYVDLTDAFASGEPNNKDDKEHCLGMNFNLDMKLNDRICDIEGRWWKHFQPLCQKSLAA
eukprot:GFUD01117107.1.p1 GENE.GFUD01117107.1~~GFUD01117107.1.p1  ORF type:complete len:188 (-),score=32.47 GFUD01117107.1:17-517(-)